MDQSVKKYLESVKKDCINCGLCENIQKESGQRAMSFGSIASKLLDSQSKSDLLHKQLSVNDISDDVYDFARSCMLCNRCTASCPSGIRGGEVSNSVRNEIASINPEIAKEYRGYRCDLKNSIFTRTRAIWNMDYPEALPMDLKQSAYAGKSLYFPGCSLINNFPSLGITIYQELLNKGYCDCMTMACCGITLRQVGLVENFKDYAKKLCVRIEKAGIKRIVTACPNCYYMLPRILEAGNQPKSIEIFALPRLLAEKGYRYQSNKKHSLSKISIHDSCPDRYDGVFAGALRELFSSIQVIEMKHNRKNSMCCGNGGFASSYDSKLAEAALSSRVNEFKETGADAIVAACVTCSTVFKMPGYFKNAYHYMELLLGCDMDMNGYSYIMNKLWDPKGPDGYVEQFKDMSPYFIGD